MITPPFASDISIVCTIPEQVESYLGHEWSLVYLTGILCLATVGLMIYTAGLYRATVKLSRDAEATADMQRADTLRALVASESSAKSAERSTEIASQSMITSQRALLFWKGFNFGYNTQQDDLVGYVLWAEAQNHGLTPALEVRVTIQITRVNSNFDGVPIFDPQFKEGTSSIVAPQMGARTTMTPIPMKDLVDCFEGKVRIYAWCRVEYCDVFSSQFLHHHEQCVELDLIHDPSCQPPEGHSPYLRFKAAGTQNSTQ
jgi:hypothetical protein